MGTNTRLDDGTIRYDSPGAVPLREAQDVETCTAAPPKVLVSQSPLADHRAPFRAPPDPRIARIARAL